MRPTRSTARCYHGASVRKIIHVDMDAFYASVEQRDRPELRGLPVAVCSAGERAVVMTASYEARRYGVGSAMPVQRAQRACPELLLVPARMSVYREVSRTVREVFRRFTDIIEPLALDEAYLDVTEPKVPPASATLLARRIRADIVSETGLTASAGVAGNKFLAKVASGMNKPDGLTVILPEQAEAFLAGLEVERFHGVGPRTAERMRGMGIRTGADLRALGEAELERRFGKNGRFFYQVACNQDDRPVDADREHKSISAETTFDRDLASREELEPVLLQLCMDVARRLERADLVARTVTVKLRYPDFRIVTRSRTLASDASDARELLAASALLAFGTRRPEGALRLLGVTVSNLRSRSASVVQPPLAFPS